MDSELLTKDCSCKATVFGVAMEEGAQTATANIAQMYASQIRLADIAAATDNNVMLSRMREAITRDDNQDLVVQVSLKLPRIIILALNELSTELKVETIKPIQLAIVQGAVMVNNRA